MSRTEWIYLLHGILKREKNVAERPRIASGTRFAGSFVATLIYRQLDPRTTAAARRRTESRKSWIIASTRYHRQHQGHCNRFPCHGLIWWRCMDLGHVQNGSGYARFDRNPPDCLERGLCCFAGPFLWLWTWPFKNNLFYSKPGDLG